MENRSELAPPLPIERAEAGLDCAQGRLSTRRFRWSMDHGLGILRHRALIIAVSIFAVMIMLVSGLPSEVAQHVDDSGLVANTTPAPPVPTFYPYLVPTGDYPLPDTLNTSLHGGGYMDPQVVSTISGGVPTFYMVSSNVYGSCTGEFGPEPCPALDLSIGKYSPQMALNILNGSGTHHVPISWSTPLQIWGSLTVGFISGDAITTNAAGSFIMLAAATSEDGTFVFLYTTSSGSWGSASPWTVSGQNPQFSFGGAAALLVTSTSTQLYTTTYYESGVTSASETIPIAHDYFAPFWTPSAGMGDEGIVVTTPSNTIDLET